MLIMGIGGVWVLYGQQTRWAGIALGHKHGPPFRDLQSNRLTLSFRLLLPIAMGDMPLQAVLRHAARRVLTANPDALGFPR